MKLLLYYLELLLFPCIIFSLRICFMRRSQIIYMLIYIYLYIKVYNYNITWNNKSLYGYIYILSFYYMVKFEYNFLIISRNNKEILIIMH